MKPAPSSSNKHLSAELDARYRAPLLAYFQRRTASRAEAEALTQKVLLRLVWRVDGEGPESAAGLIFTIAAGLLRDRAGRAGGRSASGRAEDRSHAADDAAPADGMRRAPLPPRETLIMVLDALDGVSPGARDMFLLYRLEGLRQREIADLLGVDIGAVEANIVKVLKHLAAALG